MKEQKYYKKYKTLKFETKIFCLMISFQEEKIIITTRPYTFEMVVRMVVRKRKKNNNG